MITILFCNAGVNFLKGIQVYIYIKRMQCKHFLTLPSPYMYIEHLCIWLTQFWGENMILLNISRSNNNQHKSTSDVCAHPPKMQLCMMSLAALRQVIYLCHGMRGKRAVHMLKTYYMVHQTNNIPKIDPCEIGEQSRLNFPCNIQISNKFCHILSKCT